MLEFNNYYIKEQENLTGLFANIFVISIKNTQILYLRIFIETH